MIASDIAECSLFTALMIAAAFIQIPFPLMPLTFQTAVAVLSGLLLGWKKGMIAMSAYLLMGLIGIPVFTAGGGIYYVLKPSFGYILGFIASAGVGGAICGKGKPTTARFVIAAVAAFLADYIIGVPYCMATGYMLGVADLTGLLITGNLVFMPKDAALSVAGAFVARGVCAATARLRK